MPSADFALPSSAGQQRPALRIDELTVRYGSLSAVDGLSLVAPPSAITAILGPNGAGKTTTLEVCEGLRQRTAGSVEVLGTEPWRAPAHHRARLGVLLQRAGLPSGMRAVEAVRSAAELFADPYPVDELIERLRLGGLAKRPFRRLSGGEQQRVGLAVAIVGRPDLLLLDEPTSGMDPATRRDTWELLGQLTAAGTSVVVTTHQIDEAESAADHVVVIARGQAVLAGSPHDLVAGPGTVRFVAPPGLPITQVAVGTGAEIAPGTYLVTGSTGIDDAALMAAVLDWCRARSVTPTSLSSGGPSLESVVLARVDWEEVR